MSKSHEDLTIKTEEECFHRNYKIVVRETLNAIIKEGLVLRMALSGDIYVVCSSWCDVEPQITFGFNKPEEATFSQGSSFQNPKLVSDAASFAEPNTFTLDATKCSPDSEGRVCVASYQIFEADPASIPLLVQPHWKIEDQRVSLIMLYQRNPLIRLSLESTVIKNISFMVATADNIQQVQSKPSGIWSSAKQRMVWKAADIAGREEEQILARFVGEGVGAMDPVAVKFELNALASGAAIAATVPVECHTHAGKYYAHGAAQ